MKLIISTLFVIIIFSWLFYGINPFAILLVAPAIWLFIGGPVILFTKIKGIVPRKPNALFISSVLLYFGQIVLFVFSFTVEGIYNFSGHGTSDPSSIYWHYAIMAIGFLSIFSYVGALSFGVDKKL